MNLTVDVDLGQSVVNGLLLVSACQGLLQERQEKLQAITCLDLSDQLIDRDGRGGDRGKKALDDALIAIDIKQTTNDCRSPGRVDALDVNLDRLELLLLVKVQDQVVDEVESVAHDDERQLLSQVGLLEEVYHLLGVKVVCKSCQSMLQNTRRHPGVRMDVKRRGK
jgi:hypothetical protein